MILLLSNKWDITVDFVVRELKRRNAEFLRINTEDLTKDGVAFYFPGPRLMVTRDGKAHDLSSCITAIWCRRPGKPFDFLPREEKPSEAIQKFASDQWYACLEALELIWIRTINYLAPCAFSMSEISGRFANSRGRWPAVSWALTSTASALRNRSTASLSPRLIASRKSSWL